MIKSRKHESGFGLVEVLATIGVIALVGGLGWVAYSNFVVKPSTSSTKTPQENKETATSQQKYLEIKEEGIKFKLTDAISDTYYRYYGEEGGVIFGVHSLDSISSCKPHEVNGTGLRTWVGVAKLDFDKYTAPTGRTDQAPEASALKNDPSAVRVGDNWYEIATDDPTGCKSTDAKTQVKIQSVQDALKEASKTFVKL